MSRRNVVSKPGLSKRPVFGRAIGALTFFFTLGLAFAACADETAYETVSLGQGVYSFGTYAARSVFVVTSAGVIATDPVDAPHATAMREAISALTPLPVRYVVYSHAHWDHAAGGQIFKDEGARFVSHASCMDFWRRHPNPDIVAPDELLEGSGQIELGETVLRLQYHGRNHGDCMLIMRVEGSDVLYVNDLVTPFNVGLGAMPDYDPGEWVRTLEELEADRSWRRMVGGHGVPVAPREALSQRRRYLQALMTAVREGMKKGLRYEALYDSIQLPQEFRDMRGYDLQLRRGAERIFHYYNMGW